MAQKQDFSGLFSGPSEGDIKQLQSLEREKRIRQACADASGSGGGNSGSSGNGDAFSGDDFGAWE